MQRVQDALKAQLTKQNEKLEIELREKVGKCEIFYLAIVNANRLKL